MKSLIRFEDRYGMADIFCKMHKLDYISTLNTLIKVSNDLYIETGSGFNIFHFDEAFKFELMFRGIERVIFVFDLDNESGIKTEIMSKNYVNRKIYELVNVFKSLGYAILFEFIPTVYSAETILLYQHISKNCLDTFIESLVHCDDTNKFHLIPLAILNKLHKYSDAKKFRDIINKEKLESNIKLNLWHEEDNINLNMLEWILSGCDLNKHFLNQKELEKLMDEAYILFHKYRDMKIELSVLNMSIDTNISINKLIAILKEVTQEA